jgi:hypothetical protein
MAVCWDTAHGNLNEKARGEGQYKCITDIGERLKGVHISDNFAPGRHQHSWPFAGDINFDQVLQGLLDVEYDGYFTFEASYTLLHNTNCPCLRRPWEREGETVSKLFNLPIALKKQANQLLYDLGKYILEAYDCFEED